MYVIYITSVQINLLLPSIDDFIQNRQNHKFRLKVAENDAGHFIDRKSILRILLYEEILNFTESKKSICIP